MSCINPMAPLRETALGLKFDSTFTSARTRFGSTLWRVAALSIAASTSCCVNPLRVTEYGSTDGFPRYWSTSAAADFAACALTRGTGFQRCSVVLQKTRLLCCDRPCWDRFCWERCVCFGAGASSSLVYTLWPLASVAGVIWTFVAACTHGVTERRVAIAVATIRASCRRIRIPGQCFQAEARNTSAPTFPEPDGEFLPE